MSYILEALKKADSERKKGNAYANVTLNAPYAMPAEKSKTKIWYWLVTLNILILVSILGVCTYLYRSYFSQSPNLSQTSSNDGSVNVIRQESNQQNMQKDKVANDDVKNAFKDSKLGPQDVKENLQTLVSGSPEKLDVHVFSNQPEKRFVMIKGNVLMVGDKADGWQLKNITVDGAEFEKNGQKVSVSAKH